MDEIATEENAIIIFAWKMHVNVVAYCEKSYCLRRQIIRHAEKEIVTGSYKCFHWCNCKTAAHKCLNLQLERN
jgi:hypothetical protein